MQFERLNAKIWCSEYFHNTLCSNHHYKTDAKEFDVIMQILNFCQIKCLNLNKMTVGSLSSSIVFASQRWKLGENMQKKMPVFSLITLMPSIEGVWFFVVVMFPILFLNFSTDCRKGDFPPFFGKKDSQFFSCLKTKVNFHVPKF